MGAGLADMTLKQFADNVTKAANGGLRQNIHRLLKAMALSGQGYAQKNYGRNGLGVVTGHLKQSIRFEALTSGSQLGVLGRAGDDAQVRYAAVHEFGYQGIPARPYISPAMDYLREQIGKDFGKIFHSSVLGKGPSSGKWFG